MKQPLVSFIITYYNLSPLLLHECIDSILALSLKKEEREIIVIDDGSRVAPVDELKDILADDTRPVFVSLSEDGVVEGYAFCILKQCLGDNILTEIRTLYIDDLCVDELLRGKHIGTGLYQHVLQYAKALGCHNVTLNVWALNEGARRFYEKCGLVPQKVTMEALL